ncbi:MAG: hypothetical protein V4808_03950 [Pseudomonadota bacterium]
MDKPLLADSPPEFREFILTLGWAVFQWNSFERAVKQLLTELVRSGNPFDMRGEILTAELGSRQLADALRAFGNDIFRGKDEGALVHCAKLFDGVLAYRNTYIHNIHMVVPEKLAEPSPDKYIACFTTTSARSNVRDWHATVALADLENFVKWSDGGAIYATGLRFSHLCNFPGPQRPLPDKPPLPPPLTKNARMRRELLYPPPPSPE